MPDRSPLALDFSQRRPQPAAAVLEDLPPEDAAAFLASIPVRIAAPLITRMAPWAAARSVECMKVEGAADLIANVPYQDAASMIRLIEESRRQSILAKLPRDRQNLLFSATMPKAIRGLANGVLRDPHVVELAHTAPAERVEHALYPTCLLYTSPSPRDS